LALAPTLFGAVGGEPTLDELIAGVWEGLAVHRVVACPVCGGEMEPEAGGDGRSATRGCCHDCGSILS
jgi:hypothetical protein